MKRALVRLQNVDVDLGGRRVLHALNWQLHPGEHWSILGANGSGKSTFLKLVRGELWPAPGCTGQRVYHVQGEEQFSAVGIKEQFAMVSPEAQNRYLYQEWNLRVLPVLQSGVGGGDYVYQELTPDQRQAVERAAEWMAITHLLRRNVQELSTGELRRVLVARALAAGPRVLICDEICDSLDAASRSALLASLDRAARGGTQLLLTTHRADEILPVITHQLRMENGRIVEQGRAGKQGSTFFSASPPLLDPTEERSRAGRVTETAAPAKTKLGRGVPPAGAVLIRIQRANVHFDAKQALFDVDLEIRAGQHWAILGANGSGKSTLLKLIGGDVHPAVGGRVRRFEFTARNTIWELRKRIGTVSPELQANYRESIAGADVVASGFFSSVGLVRRLSVAQRRRVAELIAELGLTALAGKNFLEMSYGEARRILLARALVKRPALVLLDEPLDGLDVGARASMSRTLEHVADSGATLVMVTHHLEDLPRGMTHVVAMEGGRMRYAGPRDDYPG